MKYYFASKKCFDNITLEPRIPEHKFNNEDNITQRICVSQSIHGCLSALGVRFSIGEIVYIHECESNNVIQPTLEQVADKCFTGEQWIIEPVKMKLFTKVVITDLINMTLGKMDSMICKFDLEYD